ncbi:sulfurtransferase TusA family protein [Vibrio maerlii]|uniref:sulfurtransferase TusA family protein n=1 Tax=Vibrio maerlii TaxID=2231648 RepID=UPI000E3E4874|nr:sulfurtransferase TusA family protein [Vibrio maerlii]
MKANILDLRRERCPMALLLAKRESKSLKTGSKLSIYVQDAASLQDMLRYFQQQALNVELHSEPEFSIISLSHKE